jgi:hypothetical protein
MTNTLARRWRLSTKAEHATDEHGVMIGALLRSARAAAAPRGCGDRLRDASAGGAPLEPMQILKKDLR